MSDDASVEAHHQANWTSQQKIATLYLEFLSAVRDPSVQQEDLIERHNNLLKEIAVYEFERAKLSIVKNTTLKDAKILETNVLDLEQKIASQREQLQQLQHQLSQEQMFRMHRQEYDALAGAILQLPDRQHQEQKLGKLLGELGALQQENKSLCDTLDLRTKQFSVLLQAVHSLDKMFEQEATSQQEKK